MKSKYEGITYDKDGKFDCKQGIHKLDEVWSFDEHYLVCDECQLMIHIAKIDKTYMNKKSNQNIRTMATGYRNIGSSSLRNL